MAHCARLFIVFRAIPTATVRIRAVMTGVIPLNTVFTAGTSPYVKYRPDNTHTNKKEGRIIPAKAAAAPTAPRRRYPTYTITFTATGPGKTEVSDTPSSNSSARNFLSISTTCFCTIATSDI